MKNKPNIIYIYGDDLGRGMLSCYGQKQFATPHIDELARQGMLFTKCYGCALCAPARASLLTGIHDCHAGGWSYTSGGIYEHLGEEYTLSDIYELLNNTGFQNAKAQSFLPHILKSAGYFTGQIGKLEWGFATTEQDINNHGWDYHYGYYDHRLCHGFYPPYLFENGIMVPIEGNTHKDCGKNPTRETPEHYIQRHDMQGKNKYSQDLFNEKIVEFITSHKEGPFFLFHPSQLPHGPIAVPEIHEGVRNNQYLTEYEKEYASMVLRLDDTVGIVVETLKKLDLLDDTIIFFSADNGHEVYYQQDNRTEANKNIHTGEPFDEVYNCFTTENSNDVFNGNSGLKGKKRSSLEGGVRVPNIVSWKGHIKPGTVSNRLISNYDLMPTLAEMIDIKMPDGKDGISYYKELIGGVSKEKPYVVYASHSGPGLTMSNGWKIRYAIKYKVFQLYNLNVDEKEQNDLSEKYPELVKQLGMILLKECDGNFDNGTPFSHRATNIDLLMNQNLDYNF